MAATPIAMMNIGNSADVRKRKVRDTVPTSSTTLKVPWSVRRTTSYRHRAGTRYPIYPDFDMIFADSYDIKGLSAKCLNQSSYKVG